MSRTATYRTASTTNNKSVTVYRDSETSEFVARLYINGILQPDADCFESFNSHDKLSILEAQEAAISTAHAMIR